jgi:large subunit ribosomal protein L3
MGRKRGMVQRFDTNGNIVVCTVIQAEPNVVTQLKTVENDGYSSVQLGFEKIKAKDPRRLADRTTKPLTGHFAKANVEPRKHLLESRVEKVDQYTLGQEFGVDFFNEVAFVDVQSVSKGKGYQGVMKLHGFGGGPAAHGSGFHRHGGSTGMRSTPGRCLPGGKRASRMGGNVTTVENLKVVAVDEKNNVLLVKGSVPGATGALVVISRATKKDSVKKVTK